MSEPRRPSPRRAEARASESAGVNPLERPLPPGLTGRRVAPGTHVSAAATPPATSRVPRRADPPSPAPFTTPRHERTPSASTSGRRHADSSNFDAAFEPVAPRSPRSPHREPAAASRAEPARAEAAANDRSAEAPRSAPPRSSARRAGASVRAGGGRGAATATAGSAIPFAAPPAWQVAGLREEERQLAADRASVAQRGLPAWAALLVLLAITGVGGLIDALGGAGIKGAFAIGLILGSLVAVLLVRRRAMFPIVVAPPLVYFAASAVLLYIRSGGLSSRSAIVDAATSWLVYGFPSIAGATAIVLIVAGVRMVLHR